MYLSAVYHYLAGVFSDQFDQDFSKILYYIQVKIDWPLSMKRLLLHRIKEDQPNINDRLNNIANFVFDPTANLVRTHRSQKFAPTIASIERNYGSGVSAIFHLQYGFFLLNLLTLILWLALIILPYTFLSSSSSSSNLSFSFSSIFTSKDYLSQSLLFQGSYQNDRLSKSYDLPLIYFITTYLYFFIWFIFLTIRFSSTYKQKVFHSILNTKLGIGFTCTFGRWNFTIQSYREKEKHGQIFRRQFFDLIENDERIKENHSQYYRTWSYRLKLVITNLFFILLTIFIGENWKFLFAIENENFGVVFFLFKAGMNWLILSFCNEKSPIDCYGSIIFLALINRLMPYVIVILTQVEQYKYLSYKLDVVGYRFVLKKKSLDRLHSSLDV